MYNMGIISAVVQDERGNQLGQRVDLPTSLLPDLHDTRFTCLRFVDPYGDTLFNRLQVQLLLEDLRVLETLAQSYEQQNAIQRIRALVEECQKEPHLYLKFTGD